MVQLQLILIATATSFGNTLVVGLAGEKYFSVNLQLVGCTYIYNKNTTHDIDCRIYFMHR